MITIAQAILVAGPTDKWPGNCGGIAHCILPLLPEGAVTQYGMYYGPVHEDSQFYPPFKLGTRHGWCRVGDLIVDPTRWVFENVEPYIYMCSADSSDYDFGMKRVRAHFRQPCPENSGREADIDWGIATEFVTDLTGKALPLCLHQACWVANEIPENLVHFTKEVHRALIDAGFSALIPVDFAQEVGA